MQEFIHHKVEIYQGFLKDFNKIQTLLGNRSFEFERRFDEFTQTLLSYFQTSGNTTVESEILKIVNSVFTVKKGFNPVKMEKIQTGRREMYWGFSFSATESIFEILMELMNKEKVKLEEGEELVSNLILMLIQNNIMDDAKIAELNTITKIEVYWNLIIKQNESIAGINKKLRMTLLAEDIYLLFEKNLAKINT
ncbi:hypothetical protein [Polaribacter sp. L3A8]|uniref:hypothetical protein n=1 Tax=Polaribacter sp. L3A8 TaxID=2686361 RepID=UPI00131B026D|nr:hypothetical protein [Polaribacter sp. L3A8]